METDAPGPPLASSLPPGVYDIGLAPVSAPQRRNRVVIRAPIILPELPWVKDQGQSTPFLVEYEAVTHEHQEAKLLWPRVKVGAGMRVVAPIHERFSFLMNARPIPGTLKLVPHFYDVTLDWATNVEWLLRSGRALAAPYLTLSSE